MNPVRQREDELMNEDVQVSDGDGDESVKA
jgi:hypothetical protein